MRTMTGIDFKTRREWYRAEMRKALSEGEYNELWREMNKLLKRDDCCLSAYGELLADYGLEPDYLMAWIG